MKEDDRKQKPIFSKVKDILEDPPSRTPSQKPLDQNEGSLLTETMEREDFSPGPSITRFMDVSDPAPNDQVISKAETIVEVVSPRVTPYPEGIEVMVNSLDMAFVLIPAGTFLMGSPEHEPGRHDDERQHEVTISKSFYLQTTPVTQGQWQRLMANNPSNFKKCGKDCPVEQVSWFDAQRFIKELNQMEKTDKYYLPTEAEWEYACRAGSTSRFTFGDDSERLEDYAWYNKNSQDETHFVGQLKPNAWGLYDMHGNVYEWCQDWYGDYPTGSVTDPKGPSSGRGRVLRGGSWNYDALLARSAFRYYYDPEFRYLNYGFGFRVARAL